MKNVSRIISVWFCISVVSFNHIFLMPLFEICLIYVSGGVDENYGISQMGSNASTVVTGFILTAHAIVIFLAFCLIFLGFLFMFFGD